MDQLITQQIENMCRMLTKTREDVKVLRAAVTNLHMALASGDDAPPVGMEKLIPVSDEEQRNLINANVLSVNAAIKELANELELTLIDMAAVLAYEDGELKPEYSADGIHFNEAGNNLWYDAVSEYVNLI